MSLYKSSDVISTNIIVGCTGSVASVKIPILVKKLTSLNKNVRVCIVPTEKAKQFFNIAKAENCARVVCDNVEWESWRAIGDGVVHIDFRKWAHLLLIAPLDANTLGKISSGICDNLITCITRAWDTNKPLIFCPAMNTRMWEHPVTRKQIDVLKNFGYHEISPISKNLACKEVGLGAMAEVDEIVKCVKEVLTIL